MSSLSKYINEGSLKWKKKQTDKQVAEKIFQFCRASIKQN